MKYKGYAIEVYKLDGDYEIEVADWRNRAVRDCIVPVFIEEKDYLESKTESIGEVIKHSIKVLEDRIFESK